MSKPSEAETPNKSFIPPVPVGRVKPLWRRILAWTIWIVAWIVTILMLRLAYLRLVHHDATVILTSINAFTRYIYLPAYVIFFGALFRKCWVLCATSLALVLLHLWLVVPDFQTVAHTPPDTKEQDVTSKSIRIVFHNIFMKNDQLNETRESDLLYDPNVLIIAEYSRDLHTFGLPQMFEHDTLFNRPWYGYEAVFSDYPFYFLRRMRGKAPMILFDTMIDIKGVPLRIIVVHAPRPVMDADATPKSVAKHFAKTIFTPTKAVAESGYDEYMSNLHQIMKESTGATIVIGDFNATQYSKWIQKLTSGRFRSAHLEVGKGHHTTWPSGKFTSPPIRIDHALLSPEVECLDLITGRAIGSDHQPLILDVRATGPRVETRPKPLKRLEFIQLK